MVIKIFRQTYVFFNLNFLIILLFLFFGFIKQIFPGSIILKNGNYISIEEKKALSFSYITIENGKIIAIQRKAPPRIDNNISNVIELDLKGQYLSPGLVSWSKNISEPIAQTHSGITTSIILGGRKPNIEKKRRTFAYFYFPKIPYSQQVGDTLFSGPIIVLGDQKFSDQDFLLKKPIQKIQERKDLTKLFQEWEQKGPPSFVYVSIYSNKKDIYFPTNFLKELISWSQTNKLKVIAYVASSTDALFAIKQGADIISMDLGTVGIQEKELLKLSEKQIPLITCISCYEGWGKFYRKEKKFATLKEIAKNNLKKFFSFGGKVIIGNSRITPWIVSGLPFQEISVYKDMGISDEIILESLTTLPIKVFGLNKNFKSKLNNISSTSPSTSSSKKKNPKPQIPKGKILPNYAADLIITVENPLININTLTNIRVVINDGYLIRNENNIQNHIEIDLAYSQYFTRKELMESLLIPKIDSYPYTTHLTLSPLFSGILMHDGLNRFEFGLFSRFIFPSSWKFHQLIFSKSAVLYQPMLFHLKFDYLHFFTQRLGWGIMTSYIPNSHYIVGTHLQLRAIPYIYPGSKQWFVFDGYINFENYDVEKTKLLSIRSKNTFDFYDFMPNVISVFNFRIEIDGAIALKKENHKVGQYLKETFLLNFGLSVWKNRFWQAQIWGNSLNRFRLQESDGGFKTLKTVGKSRSYDESDFKDHLLGWLTMIDIPFFSFGDIAFKNNFFWEMQKRDVSFTKLFLWDNKWIMDFGYGISITLENFGAEIGVYFPTKFNGKVTLPGFYGGIIGSF